MSSSPEREGKKQGSPVGLYSKARDERRRAERDEQLLANRIALLKQEEAKAWKKIQQTKVRAERVLTLREENRKRGQEAKRVIEQQHRYEGRDRGQHPEHGCDGYFLDTYLSSFDWILNFLTFFVDAFANNNGIIH